MQKCLKIICHISFKDLNFDKKKIIVSLFLLELLSSQKTLLIRSSTDNLHLKIRQGSPVACKVTLRKKNMYEMFDSLLLAFTRISTRSFIKVSKKIQIQGGRYFSYQLDSLERFFHLTSITLGEETRKLDYTFVFSNHI
jgi:large subunit ribosomal protein L5